MKEKEKNEIWAKVKRLKGIELYTYVEKESNLIIEVEDTNSLNDRVIIHNRKTQPTKQDILAAYELLIIKGELKRKPDLEWLASPDKKVSSIVFRIIGEISKPNTIIKWNSKKNPVIKIINVKI